MSFGRITRTFIFLLLTGSLPLVAGQNEVRKVNQQGNQLFDEGDWALALEQYAAAGELDPQNPVLHYNLANTLFELNDLEQAETHYRVAAAAEDQELARRARFNLGNTEFRRAETLEGAGDWQGRNQALAKAMESWKQVLETDPANLDAKRNLELAWKKLQEEPPEDQQQDQQDQEQDQDQEKQDQEQDQEQKQEQEQEEDSEQDEQEQQQQQEEEKDEEKEQQQQQGEEEEEQQQESQDQPQPEEQPQTGEEQQEEMRISPEEAQRILDALRDEELEEQKRQMAERKGKGGSAERDW